MMHGWKWKASLVVLLALVLAWPASAQVSGDGVKVKDLTGARTGGITQADSLYHVFRTDASGSQLVKEASKDRDNWYVWTNAINDTITVGSGVIPSVGNNPNGANFTAESTLVLPVAQYRRFTLHFWVKPSGSDSTTLIRLAVQVRKHLDATGDSSSTTVWSEWNLPAATPTVTDSIGHYLTAGTAPQAMSSILWPGERIITFNPKHGYGHIGTNMNFSWPNGVSYDLVDPRGQWFWAPYMSVRVRVLTGATGGLTTKPRVIMAVAAGS